MCPLGRQVAAPPSELVAVKTQAAHFRSVARDVVIVDDAAAIVTRASAS